MVSSPFLSEGGAAQSSGDSGDSADRVQPQTGGEDFEDSKGFWVDKMTGVTGVTGACFFGCL